MRIQKRLCDLQTRHSGAISNGIILFADDGTDDKTHCGIGCRFLRMDMAFWYGVVHRLPVLSAPSGLWEYTASSKCLGGNHECYFQPLAALPAPDWVADRHSRMIVQSVNTANIGTHASKLHDVKLWLRKDLDNFRFNHSFGIPWKNQDLSVADKNGCWIAAQILFYMLKPNLMLEEAILKAKAKLGLTRNKSCIAVHVRHGWRARFNSEIKMTDFVHAIRRFNSTKSVLLITEDEDVIRDAVSHFPEYEWLYTDYPRENKHDIGVAMSKGQVDPTAEAVNALVNLFLSSECDFFVGRVNSTWFRLMIMLSYGRNGVMPPFDNLLEDWGHGGLRKWGFFGMCTLSELKKEVTLLKAKYPRLVKMNAERIK